MTKADICRATDHIPACAQLEKHPCWNGLIERGTTQHRWSGWPGAHCLTCHMEDKDEVCLALNCLCPCHAAFWEAYRITCAALPDMEDL